MAGDGRAQGPPPLALLSSGGQWAVCYFHVSSLHCVCSGLNSHDAVTGGAGIPGLVG